MSGDFHVPTPVIVDANQLVLTGESNGTRLHRFSPEGKIVERPIATNRQLAPDMSTPIVVGRRLFCAWHEVYCLDLADQLREIWTAEDSAVGEYAPLIASDDRLLILGRGGELLLVDPRADSWQVISRAKPLADLEKGNAVVYAYPAIVGEKLFLRVGKTLACVSLRASAH